MRAGFFVFIRILNESTWMLTPRKYVCGLSSSTHRSWWYRAVIGLFGSLKLIAGAAAAGPKLHSTAFWIRSRRQFPGSDDCLTGCQSLVTRQLFVSSRYLTLLLGGNSAVRFPYFSKGLYFDFNKLRLNRFLPGCDIHWVAGVWFAFFYPVADLGDEVGCLWGGQHPKAGWQFQQLRSGCWESRCPGLSPHPAVELFILKDDGGKTRRSDSNCFADLLTPKLLDHRTWTKCSAS